MPRPATAWKGTSKAATMPSQGTDPNSSLAQSLFAEFNTEYEGAPGSGS